MIELLEQRQFTLQGRDFKLVRCGINSVYEELEFHANESVGKLELLHKIHAEKHESDIMLTQISLTTSFGNLFVRSQIAHCEVKAMLYSETYFEYLFNAHRHQILRTLLDEIVDDDDDLLISKILKMCYDSEMSDKEYDLTQMIIKLFNKRKI